MLTCLVKVAVTIPLICTENNSKHHGTRWSFASASLVRGATGYVVVLRQEKWVEVEEETGLTLHWPLPLSIIWTLQGMTKGLWGKPYQKEACETR